MSVVLGYRPSSTLAEQQHRVLSALLAALCCYKTLGWTLGTIQLGIQYVARRRFAIMEMRTMTRY